MSADSFAPSVMMKLMKDIRSLHDSPIEGITVSHPHHTTRAPLTIPPPASHLTHQPAPPSPLSVLALQLLVSEESLSSVVAELDGPVGTPFEGGRFRVRLALPSDFPQSPPKGHFLTKIFHPNVSSSGEICVNTLKKDWKASHGLPHVLLVVRCLLIQPNPESALNEEAGKLLMEAYEEYDKRARLMTRIHATATARTKDSRPQPPLTSALTTATSISTTSSSSSASSAPTSHRHRRETSTASVGVDGEGEVDEEDVRGQENRPRPSVSPNGACIDGGERGMRGVEEESKAGPNKRAAVVALKGTDRQDKARAVKKSIKRL